MEAAFSDTQGHAEMSEFFVHCGIKYSLDQASWLNSRIAALASEAGEGRGTGASIITGGRNTEAQHDKCRICKSLIYFKFY
jgi:hypothetical protein